MEEITMENKLKTVSIDTLIDRHIGQLGTEKRALFEQRLRIDLILHSIKNRRNTKHLQNFTR